MIAIHGHSWTAARFRDTSQLDQIADSKNFIVAYPDGEGSMWNAGNCCSTLGTDDVTLISGMIDSITSKYNIDKTRVWVLGHSNGAMMAYRAACEIPEKVTAIAVGAGTFAAFSCKPTKPVSVIQIHGTADQTLSIDGTIWGPSPLTSAAKYAGYAGCSAASSSTWTCPNGSQIQVKIEDGVGHYAQTWWAEMTDYLFAHPRS
jgi:polyhydroxybutyrate depolymerase